MIALYIILIILAVIMLIMFIPVDCVIDISYNDDENRGNIIVKYAFVKIKILPSEPKEEKEEDVVEETEEKPKKEKDIKAVINLVKTVYTELKDEIYKVIGHYFKRTIRIKELNISSKFGTGDPMYTGIVTGTVNAAVYNAVSLIDRKMKLDKWNVSLDSDFDNACLSAGLYCKIRTRIAYVLKIGLMAAIILLKILRINRRIKKNG